MKTSNDISGHQHYLVTEDLYVLMKKWGHQHGFIIPEEKWFNQNHRKLVAALGKVLENNDRVVLVDSLPYQYMCNEIQIQIYSTMHNLDIDLGCVISLDQVYGLKINCLHHLLDVNRVTDLVEEKIHHSHRPCTVDINHQIAAIKHSLSSYHVIIVDDGIFTGETMQWIMQKMDDHAITVDAIIVGVNIKQPGVVHDFGLKPTQIKSVANYTYTRPVLDWVCERDFFVGTPLGGRTIKGDEFCSVGDKHISVGAYYSMRSQWLYDWASVKDDDLQFRHFCIDQTCELFTHIELLSGKPVLAQDLDRLPYGFFTKSIEPDFSFLAYLKHLKKNVS